MKIGIIGYGTVGSTLGRWFKEHTKHELSILDPAKGYNDPLTGIDCCFICIPVNPAPEGQDQTNLEGCVTIAKQFTPNVFIRSTVLPGTNDRLGTTACPEFLTARRAYDDMLKLPILMGTRYYLQFTKELFPNKEIVTMTNFECELAKYGHNVLGALTVTYHNMINQICEKHGADFYNVNYGMNLTGFFTKIHQQCPGPDGKFGYNGSCFPVNVESFGYWLYHQKMPYECALIKTTNSLNDIYRKKPVQQEFEGVAI